MVKESYKMSMLFTPGRTGEEYWEEIIPDDILHWESAERYISERDYSFNGVSISLSANWKVLIRRLKKNFKLKQDFYSGRIEFSDLIFKPVNVAVKVVVSGSEELVRGFGHPGHFLEHYVHEVFLLINLSRPGACDFYNLYTLNPHSTWSRKERVRISAYNFEFAWVDSLEKEFPSLQQLPFEKVLLWYEKIGLSYKQRARSPIEKALFSLLHICRTGEDISCTVWIFHALEALFSTRVGEGFNTLSKRIKFVLCLSEKQESIVKKRLRKLYDMRSSLIHGGYEIYHPMRSEYLDKSIDEQFDEVYENIQFGVAVIISCLQSMISNNAYGLSVTEEVSYS